MSLPRRSGLNGHRRRSGRVEECVRAWFTIDLRALAAFRMGLAGIVAVDLLTRLPHLDTFYTDTGVLPRVAADTWLPAVHPSLHMMGGGLGLAGALWAVQLLAAVALLVGWKTRVATVVTWWLLVSMNLRNPPMLDGGDAVLQLLLFWGAFLPLGARYALDTRQRRPAHDAVLSVASAGLLTQLGLVYLFAGALKLYGGVWRDGTAVSLVLQQEYWARPLAAVLNALPGTPLLTYGVLAVEIGAAIGLFFPWRTRAVRLGSLGLLLAFQLGMAVTIELWLFPWVMTVALIPFLPAAVWDRVERRAGTAPPDAGGARDPFPAPARPAAAIASLALVFVVWSNLDSLTSRRLIPGFVETLGHGAALGQGWTMYAPSPYPYDFHLEVIAVLDDGTRRRLLGSTAETAWEPLGPFTRWYRAKSFVETAADPDRQPELWGLARWICRMWQSDAGQPPVAQVELTLVERPILGGQLGRPVRIPLRDEACDSPTG